MLGRRHVAVITLVAILLAGATLLALPRAAWESPQEALEATSTDPISTAVDAGTATTLLSVATNSELSSRAQAIVTGLKAGIPSDAPGFTQAQLALVQATSQGAVESATRTLTTTPLGGVGDADLRAAAQGLMAGLVARMPSAPDASTASLSSALAGSLVSGSITALSHGQLRTPSYLLVPWAQSQAQEEYAWIDANTATVAQIVGSPLLIDERAFASDIIAAQLAVLPYAASQQQLDAIGAFVGGEVVGTLAGDAQSFPQGVPTPAASELKAYFDGLAQGQPGAAVWDLASDSAVTALSTWANAVAAAAPAALLATPDITPTQATLDDLQAWGAGLAKGGYDRLTQFPGSTQDLLDDLAVYAQDTAGPGVAFLVAHEPTAPSQAGITAYADGVTAGLDGLRGAVLDSNPVLAKYLAGVTSAIASFPPGMTPSQVVIAQAFATAATDRITQRLDSIEQAVVPGVEPRLLTDMVGGMVSGLTDALNHTGTPGDPTLFQGFTGGLFTGFLESQDPDAVWTDAANFGDATRTWYESILPSALFGPLLAGAGAVTSQTQDAVTDFGKSMGQAPVDWVTGTATTVTDQGFGTAEDLVWIATLANETVAKIGPTLTPTALQKEEKEFRGAVLVYESHVQKAATNVNVVNVIHSEDITKVQAGAKGLADALLAPVSFLTPTYATKEIGAASDALGAILDNASTITKFTDPKYTGGALALIDAIGTGAQQAEAIGQKQPDRVGAQANLAAAWVGGAIKPILDAPAEKVTRDVTDRAAWLAAESAGAFLAVSNATNDQQKATSAYASSVVTWLLDADLPNVTKVGFPLVPWTYATVGAVLGNAPPNLTQDDIDAYVAYATGVAKAVQDVPTPDVLSWTGPQLTALTTWATAIAGDAPSVVTDLKDIVVVIDCEYGTASIGECPSSSSSGGNNDTGGCEGSTDPACSKGPPCDQACTASNAANATYNATQRYVTNVGSWSENATAAALRTMPTTKPTTDGIAAMQKWAVDVLGDHGIVVNTKDPSVAWNGPRGPAYDFASARASDIAAFAQSTGFAYGMLVNLTPGGAPLSGVTTDPMTDPLVAWTAALQDATADYFTDPAHHPGVPQAGDAPSLPTEPPSDPTDLKWDNQWIDSMYGAIDKSYGQLFDLVKLPDVGSYVAQYGYQLDYVTLDVIARQGVSAAFDEYGAAVDAGRAITPKTGPLGAFASGLVTAAMGAQGALIDPAEHDSQTLVTYYGGVAQGGVDGITAFASAVKDQQLPAIQAYATMLGNASWIPPPPLPQPIDSLVAPSTGSGGQNGNGTGDGSGDNSSSSQDPLTQAEDNFQAHVAGIANAVMAVPLAPAQGGVATAANYPTTLLAYAMALRDAGTLVPPLSPDQGYPSRLRMWADAESHGALTHPPTLTPQSLAPDPNLPLAIAYLQSFAGASTWTLVDQKQHDVANLTDYASAVAGSAGSLACPTNADPTKCIDAATVIGRALALLPTSGVGAPVPPTVTQPDISAIVKGLETGLPQSPGGVDDSAELALVNGILSVLMGHLQDPQAGAIAATVSSAVAQHLPPTPGAPGLPLDAVQPVAADITLYLAGANATASDDASLASGAAAYVAQSLAAGEPPSPSHIQELVLAFLAPAGGEPGNAPSPLVSVTDGRVTLQGAQLDGSSTLSGLVKGTIRVAPPASQAPGSWEIVYSTSDPTVGGTHLPLAPDGQGGYSADLTPATLATLNAPRVRFLVQETLAGGQGVTYDRNGTAFAFAIDRDLPTASVTSPGTASGSSFRVAWSGVDHDSGIRSYLVEFSDNGAPFTTRFDETAETSFSFTGAAGHTYAFRVTATDNTGNVGTASGVSRTFVPFTQQTDRAPIVRFVTPQNGSAFDGLTIPVTLNATDPDGTDPQITVCVRRANDARDLACPYEGSNTTIQLNVSGFPDGRYQLHAIASDGLLNGSTRSATFSLARAAPSFLGASADLVAGRESLVTAATTGGAKTVALKVLDGNGGVVLSRDLHDDGASGDARAGDGVWTTSVQLPLGDYTLVLLAKDASGRSANLTKSVTVKAAPAKPGTGGKGTGGGSTQPTPTTPTTSTPAPAPARKKSFLPGPGVEVVALAALAAALLSRRRRA